MDCAFAIDSVLVAVGLSKDLIIIFAGVALGIIAVRVAAGGFLKVLEKWPAIEDVAYVLIGWIAIKLFVESYGMMIGEHIEFPELIFWAGMAAIAILGTWYAMKRPAKPDEGSDPPAKSA